MIKRYLIAILIALQLCGSAWAVRTIKQNTDYALTVFMCDSSDHISGKTGLSAGLTIYASKAGGSAAAITPTVTEISSANMPGWYKLALTTAASHTDTVGDLSLRITGSGADPTDVAMQVRANVLGDTLPANATQVGGTAIKQSGGYVQTLPPAAQFVVHDGNDTTSGTTLRSTIQAAGAETVVVVGPGTFDFSTNEVSIPAGVKVIGSGIGVTKLISSSTISMFNVATRIAVKNCTITHNSGASAMFQFGTGTKVDVVLSDLFVTCSTDFVEMGNSSACSLLVERVTGDATDVVITAVAAAHNIVLRDVIFYDIGSIGVNVANGTILRGSNVHLFSRSDSVDSVLGCTGSNTLVELSKSSVTSASGAINIEIGSGATMRLTDCEFDRSQVTNNGTFRDILSPVRPTTWGRTLDVATTGEAGLDFANIKQATGATTLNNITVPITTSVTNAVSANVTQVNGTAAPSSAGRLEVLPPDTLYVAHDGNAATSGTTLRSTIQGATAGKTVLVGPGAFDFSTNRVAVPDYVNVRGAGMYSTVLTGIQITTTMIRPGNYSQLSDFGVLMGGTTTNGIGSGSTEQFIGVLVDRVAFDQQTNSSSSAISLASSNACKMLVTNSIIDAYDDVITVGGASHQLTMRNCLVKDVEDVAFTINQGKLWGDQLSVWGRTDNSADMVQVDGASSQAFIGRSLVFSPAQMGINSTTSAKTYLVGLERNRETGIDDTSGGGTLVDATAAIRPTVYGRTLDIASTGEAGLDFANIKQATAPTTLTNITVGADLTSILGAGLTGANIKANFQSFWQNAGDNTTAVVDDVGTGGSGALPTDIDMDPVPTSRTIVLVRKSTGLVGQTEHTIQEGSDPETIAVDFRNDAAANQKIFTVDDVEVVDGSEEGLTIGEAGREGTQAKFEITGVTAGTYKVRVSVTYRTGNTARGDVTVEVVE